MFCGQSLSACYRQTYFLEITPRDFVPVEQQLSAEKWHERCFTEKAIINFEPLFFIDITSMNYFDDVNN